MLTWTDANSDFFFKCHKSRCPALAELQPGLATVSYKPFSESFFTTYTHNDGFKSQFYTTV